MKRLDAYIAEHGLAQSREKAKKLIIDGNVKVNGIVVNKPSVSVEGTENIEVTSYDRYVGRGAYKLLGAFEYFDISVDGLVCADIGASTGGFTQVMLENNAKKVYAVDVGHGQLASILVNDDRVINCEGVNVRDLPSDFFEDDVMFAACDVSFISLSLILPALYNSISGSARVVVLIKPQFEAGRSAVDKHGIVKDRKVHINVLESMCAVFAKIGFSVSGLTYSPISGGDGNIEYLALLDKKKSTAKSFILKKIVDEAFDKLR